MGNRGEKGVGIMHSRAYFYTRHYTLFEELLYLCGRYTAVFGVPFFSFSLWGGGVQVSFADLSP